MNGRSRLSRWRDLRRAGLRLAVCLSPMLAGCAPGPPGVYGRPATSPSPAVPWVPPDRVAKVASVPEKAPAIPADLDAAIRNWTLADLVDLALRTSPDTKAAWASARSATAGYGSEKGAYYPKVDVGARAGRSKGSAVGGQFTYEQRTYGPTVNASWLLFDFGGREASVSEARQALVAADWAHNAAIQGVVLSVEKAYYGYLAAKGLEEAERSTLKEAEASLDAAEERRANGLGTIADVLQAKTAVSQATLAVDRLAGTIATTKGVLAVAVGLPANTDFDVTLPPVEIPRENTLNEVEYYLDLAVRERPDLGAARARAREAHAHIHKVRAEGLPAFSASGNASRVFYDNPDLYSDDYSASVQVDLPIFTGFSHENDVRRAKADADKAAEDLAATEDGVALQVWTSYFDLKTADRRVKTSDDLLASATESHDVALGRYQEGVGSILDLLAAQAALENARAEQVRARTDWFVSLAQLAHDTGTLTAPVKEARP